MAERGPRQGRPREERVDGAVLRATRELLEEERYGAFTVDAVAARAGVGKAAIYRRYGSKAELVFAAALHDMELEPPADTGSLQGDLHALVRVIDQRIGGTAAKQAVPALVAELAADPSLAERFRERFLAAELGDFAAILDRALERGELAHPIDPGLAHLLLAGSHFAALFTFYLPVDDALLADLATATALGLIAFAEAQGSRS